MPPPLPAGDVTLDDGVTGVDDSDEPDEERCRMLPRRDGDNADADGDDGDPGERGVCGVASD
jgi:hypothetical protein